MIRGFLLKIGFLIGVALFSTGCVNKATATPYPAADAAKIKTIYVKKLAADDGGVNVLIANKLRTMGYESKTGIEESPSADIIVTYVDKWMWDITMYMIELTVVVREPITDYPLATGNSMHTSLTRKSPVEMVDEVINNIFNQKGTANVEK
ncbi:MAG: hypothetical protein WCT07_04120 [Candidatus Paceibacterota bacterium]